MTQFSAPVGIWFVPWSNVATGVPSRMNVGQIFENLLGSAGRWNGEEYRVGAFDEMFSEEASRGAQPKPEEPLGDTKYSTAEKKSRKPIKSMYFLCSVGEALDLNFEVPSWACLVALDCMPANFCMGLLKIAGHDSKAPEIHQRRASERKASRMALRIRNRLQAKAYFQLYVQFISYLYVFVSVRLGTSPLLIWLFHAGTIFIPAFSTATLQVLSLMLCAGLRRALATNGCWIVNTLARRESLGLHGIPISVDSQRILKPASWVQKFGR